MNGIPPLTFLLYLFISFSSVAQNSKTLKIDVNKDVNLVKVYENVALQGYGTAYIYKELANAYYFKSEYVKAKKWFEKLFDVDNNSKATLKHRYRQTLKALGIEFKNNTYLAAHGTN